jgi:hypothetical protein
LNYYDQAREEGYKHSAAIRHAVEVSKQRNPEIPISETEVKRVLAAWRPRGSQVVLRFDRKILTEHDVEKYHWVREQVNEWRLQHQKDLNLESPPVPGRQHRGGEAFAIRFAERPQYPRHNRKRL